MSDEQLVSARRDFELACGDGMANAVFGFGEDWLRGFWLKQPDDWPEWCLTKSSAELRAMAAADGNAGPTLLGSNPSWAELIRAAEERERA